MSGPDESAAAEAARFVAKALAELEEADRHLGGAGAPGWAGDALAAVVLIKGGTTGPDDAAAVLAGREGEAAAKALGALGYRGGYFLTLSRVESVAALPGGSLRLREQLEAVEADLVVALDAAAAADLAAAFRLLGPLEPGTPVVVLGRTLLALSGLADSLDDPVSKRRVWAEFKSLLAAPEEHERGARRRPADQPLF